MSRFYTTKKRILGKLTNCTVNIYAEKPWIINKTPLKTLVKCEVCETYSIIKGNKIQERLHWHSKHHCDQEFEIFSKLLKDWTNEQRNEQFFFEKCICFFFWMVVPTRTNLLKYCDSIDWSWPNSRSAGRPYQEQNFAEGLGGRPGQLPPR